jgi:hypothetical protein
VLPQPEKPAVETAVAEVVSKAPEPAAKPTRAIKTAAQYRHDPDSVRRAFETGEFPY